MSSMYFAAVVAPPEINEKVVEWKQFMKERFGCVVALRSPAHITLIPPFWMEDSDEEKLKNAISAFSRSQIPFEINLRNFAAFKPRVIYVDILPSAELHSLHDQLEEFLVTQHRFPIKKDERSFHAHISIAARDLHKKSFRDAWEIFKEKKYEASLLTQGISLLRHNQKKWDVIYTSQFEK